MWITPRVPGTGVQLRSYADAGYDEVYVQQIGPDVEGFFAAYAKEVLPALRG
ncbi:hypothetical protein Acsp07_25970 [Actinomycetospora sp. NBRC 106378]|nr:hypothetical protein Acsp07_25970 [Actinomycetospora sp. NBRC 106378]